MITVDDDQNVEEEEVVLDEQQVDEEVIEEPEASEETETETEGEPENVPDDEDDEEDRIITIGDSPSEEESEEAKEAPGWVKKVRKVNRKLESEVKRLKRELEEKSAETVKPVELGKKPELKDFDYDEKKYEQGYDSWLEQKRQVEAQAAEQTRIIEEQNKAHEAKRAKFVEKKTEHNFKDFDDAAGIVEDTLNQTQQGILLEGAKDSALLTYALGKYPKKLEELAKISNHIEFAFALANLEAQLNIKSKKPPAPEKKITGGKSGGMSGNTDKTLERLRAKADKTGDYTEVTAYKRKLREG